MEGKRIPEPFGAVRDAPSHDGSDDLHLQLVSYTFSEGGPGRVL